ncbi:hypothetical protein [Streptomyces sp. NPDC048636]|uniref:hypothetical protein n=1 Tax=Streptomyces sp. NPDC048636 TaxID=3155762 RepID=UPI0034314DD6
MTAAAAVRTVQDAHLEGRGIVTVDLITYGETMVSSRMGRGDWEGLPTRAEIDLMRGDDVLR